MKPLSIHSIHHIGEIYYRKHCITEITEIVIGKEIHVKSGVVVSVFKLIHLDLISIRFPCERKGIGWGTTFPLHLTQMQCTISSFERT